jgi:hypothetical protein
MCGEYQLQEGLHMIQGGMQSEPNEFLLAENTKKCKVNPQPNKRESIEKAIYIRGEGRKRKSTLKMKCKKNAKRYKKQMQGIPF